MSRQTYAVVRHLSKSIYRTMRKPSYARMDSGISARSVGGAK